MNYYIEQNKKIVLFDEDRQKLEDTLALMPQYEGLEIKTTEQPIVNFQFVNTPENLTEQQSKEQYRINHLTMTALDFIDVLNNYGFTLADRQQYFNQHPEVHEKLLYCKDVYCGVVRQLCPIVIDNRMITDDMIVQAFKIKHNLSN